MLYIVRWPVFPFSMKTVLLGLALAATFFAAGGCAFMSDEDRDFYGKGWIRPSDLDKTTPRRIADPSHPETLPQADEPARTASATPEPQWLIPEQRQQ